MKYQKPYRWKSKKIYGENEGWMGKIQENIGQTIQMTHFLAIFLPFRFLLEKQHRSVKICPNFSKINFFTLFCQNFTCFPSIFPLFHPISSSKSLFFFFAVRFRYAQSTHWGTLIRPPYPPQRSLAFARSYVSPFYFFQPTY